MKRRRREKTTGNTSGVLCRRERANSTTTSNNKQETQKVGAWRSTDVNTIKGHSGADFEGYCKVNRAVDMMSFLWFSCLFRKINEIGKQYYVLIKGPNLFVYETKTSAGPKYAVELAHKKCMLHPTTTSSHTQFVTIESGLGDVEYQFEFDTRNDLDVAKRFAMAVRNDIALGETMEIKKKLGHEQDHDSMKRSSSVMYACLVAENDMIHDDDERRDDRLLAGNIVDNAFIKESVLGGGLEVLGF
mmetsp:Transcript_11428/g.21379  ORF Transcript_11428/g.21379 Transcript_11428/m.21379 type:complete len:245 (-) Transcript_11428:115-849(-)